MHRSLIFGAVLALATPAVAQDMQEPPSEPPASQPSEPPASEPPGPSTGTHSSPFGAHDTDHNGSLSRAEFTAMARARASGTPPSDADIAAAFQRADADGNGEITSAEASAMQQSPR